MRGLLNVLFLVGCLLYTTGCADQNKNLANEYPPIVRPERIPEPLHRPDYPDFKSDSELWGDKKGTMRIYGCEEWRKRNPEADC